MTREQEILKAYNEQQTKLGNQEHTFMRGAKWADAHPRWISVEDEPPPITQWVLTYNPTYDEYHFDVERYGRGENLVDFGVTHWMPLPAPPTCSEKPNNCKKGAKNDNS